MEKDIIELFSQLYTDMQVPVSLGQINGPTRKNWMNIKNTLNLFGWVTVDQVKESIVNYLYKDLAEQLKAINSKDTK